jgi:hypothetical protein
MQITIKSLFIGTSIVVLLAIIILIVIIKREKYEVTWTENRRNNVSFNKYPPCYDICGSTRNIYDEIERAGKLEEYKKLLDVYSMVLCQVKYINSRNVREMMTDRITELIKFGGDTDESKYSGVLAMYPTPCDRSRLFMGLATSLIENEIRKIDSDGGFSEEAKQKIKGFNRSFYNNNYSVIARARLGRNF